MIHRYARKMTKWVPHEVGGFDGTMKCIRPMALFLLIFFERAAAGAQMLGVA